MLGQVADQRRATQESLSRARQMLAAREKWPQPAEVGAQENSQLAGNRTALAPQDPLPRVLGTSAAAPPRKADGPVSAAMQSSRSEPVTPRHPNLNHEIFSFFQAAACTAAWWRNCLFTLALPSLRLARRDLLAGQRESGVGARS